MRLALQPAIRQHPRIDTMCTEGLSSFVAGLLQLVLFSEARGFPSLLRLDATQLAQLSVKELLPSGRVTLHEVAGEHAQKEFDPVH